MNRNRQNMHKMIQYRKFELPDCIKEEHMYINTGYLNNSHMDFKDKSQPLIIGSCGTYRLTTHPKLPTYRPKGRLDFQIIYIASGKGHFHCGKSHCNWAGAGSGLSAGCHPYRAEIYRRQGGGSHCPLWGYSGLHRGAGSAGRPDRL